VTIEAALPPLLDVVPRAGGDECEGAVGELLFLAQPGVPTTGPVGLFSRGKTSVGSGLQMDVLVGSSGGRLYCTVGGYTALNLDLSQSLNQEDSTITRNQPCF
jgi:hypothetical protein